MSKVSRADLESALRALAVKPSGENETVCRLEEPWQLLTETGAETGLWSCSASWLSRRSPEPIWSRLTVNNVPKENIGPRMLAALKACG